MSKDLISCISKALSDGEISKSAADDIIDFYNHEVNTKKTPKMEAAKKALAEASYKKARQKFLAGNNAKARKNLVELIDNHTDGGYEAIFGLLTKNMTGNSVNSNIEYRAKAIRGMVEARMANAIDDMRSKMAGLKQDAELNDNVVRELFKPSSSGSEQAKLYGDLVKQTMEDLRQLFNGAGGAIGKLEDWGLPQSHNQFNIHRAGLEKWTSSIESKLDWDRMGVAPIDRKSYLDFTFETISTGGLNKLEVGKMPKGVSSAKANAHREHRELFFKNADDWLNYQKQFGQPDPFTAITDHVIGMSNDIAMLEIMGSNPKNNFDYILEYATKYHNLSAAKENKLRKIFRIVSAEVDGMSLRTNGDFMIAALGGGMRSIQTASKLGSAVVSSVVDLSSMMTTAHYNGMGITKTVLSGFGTMINHDKLVKGTRAGIVADYASTAISSRYSEVSLGKMQSVAEFTLRASGMGVWTEAHKSSFQMELMGHLADNLSIPFERLNKNTKARLQENGFSAKDWENIGKSKLMDVDNTNMLDIENISQLHKHTDLTAVESRELAVRLMEYVSKEGDMAITTPDAHTRYYTTGGEQKGTYAGEIRRSIAQFRSFPIAMMLTHLTRNLSQDTWQSKVALTSAFTLATTMLGGLAIQMKDLIKGRDIHEIDTKFLMASVMQGGGWGIFGDFLFSDQSRFGNGFTQTLLGPVGSLGEDIISITKNNVFKAFEENRDSNFVSDLVSKGKNYIPAQNLWYTRLVFERALYDHIKEATVKNYKSKLKKHIRNMKKETGQSYWWKPTELTPSRLPK